VRFSAECLIAHSWSVRRPPYRALRAAGALCARRSAGSAPQRQPVSGVPQHPRKARSLIEKAIPSVGISRYGKSL
jgi:hypothetical protein